MASACHQQRDAHPQQVAELNSIPPAPDMISDPAMDTRRSWQKSSRRLELLSAVPAFARRGLSSWTKPMTNPSRSCRCLDSWADWALLFEGAFAIERGAAFYAFEP